MLDTARGKPAAGMLISPAGWRRPTLEAIREFETNSDGRLNGPAVQGAALKPGVYEWTVDVGDYFASAGVPSAGTISERGGPRGSLTARRTILPLRVFGH